MEWIAAITGWIEQHPTLAGLGVFLIAFSESLALVGLFMPGVVMMFAAGALVGKGILPFWPVMAWAAAGAIVGDGISFWLGRHFHQRLRVMWPFRTHPRLMAKAVDFFEHHGGKSILLGRFVGPIRPVIPAVAGMLEMPVARFVPVNVLSALLWAPLYLLPGVIFAASLELAAEVAGQLALLIGLLVGGLLLFAWLARAVYRWLHPRTYLLIQRALAWSRGHPHLGELPAALLDPEHPEAKGLTLWALLLLVASTLFFLLSHALAEGGLLPNLDQYLNRLFSQLHSPWGDVLLGRLAALANPVALLAFALGILCYLWLGRHRHALAHWLAATAFALISGTLFSLFDGNGVSALDSLLLAVVLFGFFTVLFSREMGVTLRWLPYAAITVLFVMLAFALLYLGHEPLSALLIKLSLGATWVALLGIAYRRHPASRLRPGQLGLLALLYLLATLSMAPPGTPAYRIPAAGPVLTYEQWVGESWQNLPAWRADLRGIRSHPLNVHYHGVLPSLSRQLAAAGWHEAQDLAEGRWLRWLSPSLAIAEMPVMPQVHAGRNESLRLVKATGNGGLWVLRLWPADPANGPFWIGSVSRLAIDESRWLRVPRTTGAFDEARALLERDLATGGMPFEQQTVRHPKGPTVLRLSLRDPAIDNL